MIGETTLAMLYVPLLFYLFDSFAERNSKEEDTPDEGEERVDGTADPKKSEEGD